LGEKIFFVRKGVSNEVRRNAVANWFWADSTKGRNALLVSAASGGIISATAATVLVAVGMNPSDLLINLSNKRRGRNATR
jgi:hypothetical protein